jgi:hypothetical protein
LFLPAFLPSHDITIIDMGKAKDALKEFIDAIPEKKLTGFPSSIGTIYSTKEFRFDMQGVCNLPPPFIRGIPVN